jgi:hypothetical protein
MKARKDDIREKDDLLNDENEQATPKGWEPAAPDANSAVREEKRSLDIGGSGQFAPGGYFNQRGATRPDRIDLDDYVVPPQRESRRDEE